MNDPHRQSKLYIENRIESYVAISIIFFWLLFATLIWKHKSQKQRQANIIQNFYMKKIYMTFWIDMDIYGFMDIGHNRIWSSSSLHQYIFIIFMCCSLYNRYIKPLLSLLLVDGQYNTWTHYYYITFTSSHSYIFDKDERCVWYHT